MINHPFLQSTGQATESAPHGGRQRMLAGCCGLLLLLLALVLVLVPSLKAWAEAAPRLAAGLDEAYQRQEFVRHGSESTAESGVAAKLLTLSYQAGASSGESLARLSEPPGAEQTAVLVPVPRDTDLLGDRLAAELLLAMGLEGWPVMLVSVEDSYALDDAAARDSAIVAMVAAARAELGKAGVEEVVCLVSSFSEALSAAIAKGQLTGIERLVFAATEPRAAPALPTLATLEALQGGGVKLLDLLPPAIDGRQLQLRRRTAVAAGYSDDYRAVRTPYLNAASQHTQIAKSIRGWLQNS